MLELNPIVVASNMIREARKLGDMVNEIEFRQPYLASGDQDLSEKEADAKIKAASKAVRHYKNVMDCMQEIEALNSKIEYASSLGQNLPRKALQQARQSAEGIPIISGLIGKPMPGLETLVQSQLNAMGRLQSEASKAIKLSEGEVTKMEKYGNKAWREFGKATQERIELADMIRIYDQKTAALTKLQQRTEATEKAYVDNSVQLDNIERRRKEAFNAREIAAQRLVYAVKEHELFLIKEDVVREGLHVIREANTYVSNFLDYVKKTRSTDAVIPRLVQATQAITSSYTALKNIVAKNSQEIGQSVQQLVNAVSDVDYQVLPNARTETIKHRGVLENANKKTSFDQDADRLLASMSNKYISRQA